jgi:quercetin 2,3-dioxygenase
MEIITYVRTGAITHKDSLGNVGRTAAGDVQVMGAGSGVTHSEYNSEDVETTLFQIWVHPRTPGGDPHWGERAFPKADRAGDWVVLASGFGDEGALTINADARVLGAMLLSGESLTLDISQAQSAYLVASTGRLMVNESEVEARDGVGLSGGHAYTFMAVDDAELVVVESG